MSDRLRVLVGVELVLLLMAALVVLMPRRGSTDLITLPPDLATYVTRALTAFGLANGVLLVVAVVASMVWIVSGRRSVGPVEPDDSAGRKRRASGRRRAVRRHRS